MHEFIVSFLLNSHTLVNGKHENIMLPFFIVFGAHPFEYYLKKSLPSHCLNSNMIILYILW